MKKSATIMVAVVIIALIVVAGLYFTTRPTTWQITLQAYDFFFIQSGARGNNPTLEVRSGDTVVLTLQNLGGKEHEFFVLSQLDYNSYIDALQKGQSAKEPQPAFKGARVEDVGAGKSQTATFVVGATGTYVYACLDNDGTQPLTHAHKGMFGTFQVQSGGIFILTEWLSNVPTIYLFQPYLLAAVSLVGIFTKREGSV